MIIFLVENRDYLAIDNRETSTALVLREDKTALAKVEKELSKTSNSSEHTSSKYKRKKKSKHSKSHGPKVSI